MATHKNDPRATAKAIRDKHTATLAQIRTALGAKASVEAGDLLDALVALLAADSTLNNSAAYLIESNTAAVRLRRKHAEAEATAAKPAKPTATKATGA